MVHTEKASSKTKLSTDRVYRIGQEKHVVAIRLICPNTVEEKIQKLQETKKALVKEVVKTENSLLKSLSKRELLGLFGVGLGNIDKRQLEIGYPNGA